jgi:UDP-N-acetylglucosamine 2-epimerase (non-hydrolysing)
MKIHLIAAARPNFMKIAPLYHALKKESWAEPIIVHTGQHYDLNMSDVFFQDLGLPEPHIHLGVGSGTHAEQTGQVLIAYEKVLLKERPELVIVVGDVNSTAACTMAAVKITYPTQLGENMYSKGTTNNISSPQLSAHSSKLKAHSNSKNSTNLIRANLESSSKTILTAEVNDYELSAMSYELNDRRPIVGHLEAGLRSFDRTMPEEINRMVTDALADILWTPSVDGDQNLMKEGVSAVKIHRVGNIMIDSLEMLRNRIQSENACSVLGLKEGNYGLVTLHRPSNVDNPKILENLCTMLINISREFPLVFPIHPRSRKNIEKLGLMSVLNDEAGLMILEPLNYIRFMNLIFNCRFALTDSGGIQEETTYLGIPCLTLRPNTERPITISDGTNRLCTLDDLQNQVKRVLTEKIKIPAPIDLWDGRTADRVIDSIRTIFQISTPKIQAL